ncbi:hypothetical protein MTR_2g102500 [Medicago truncatula]|uniref:Uncharacterized protein n=1 Tax=Medicago truncatula TaxID=3880 RepID=G7IMD9_MEDTR|nr:hypothetical protein MTR_2g102500 [Medicago truncatula]
MNQIQLFPKDNMGSTPPAEQQKSQYNDHVFSLDSSAFFASMIVADAARNAPAVAGAARNAPAVAVARLLNFQDTYTSLCFIFCCCMN